MSARLKADGNGTVVRGPIGHPATRTNDRKSALGAQSFHAPVSGIDSATQEAHHPAEHDVVIDAQFQRLDTGIDHLGIDDCRGAFPSGRGSSRG
jgi:hypothetical protein